MIDSVSIAIFLGFCRQREKSDENSQVTGNSRRHGTHVTSLLYSVWKYPHVLVKAQIYFENSRGYTQISNT